MGMAHEERMMEKKIELAECKGGTLEEDRS